MTVRRSVAAAQSTAPFGVMPNTLFESMNLLWLGVTNSKKWYLRVNDIRGGWNHESWRPAPSRFGRIVFPHMRNFHLFRRAASNILYQVCVRKYF